MAERSSTRRRNTRCCFGEAEPAERLTALRRDGLVYRRVDDGTIWRYAGGDAFSLLQDLQYGIDPRPFWRTRQPSNIDRVFCMYGPDIGSHAHGQCYPPDVPNYYGRLTTLLQRAAAFGRYLELVIFADVQLFPGFDTNRHLSRCYQAIVDSGHPQVLVELCNEPFKNGISRDQLAEWNRWPRVPGNAMIATGDYDIPWEGGSPLPVGNHLTWHNDGGGEWPKEPRAAADIRDGANEWGGSKCPVIINEMHPKPVSQSGDVDRFRQFAASASLFCSGANLHTDTGYGSQPWTDAERIFADAFFEGLFFAPPEAQLADYIRGGANNQNIGDLGIVHHDLDEPQEVRANRTYAKIVGDTQYAVACDPAETWTAVPQNGWQIVGQPGRGLVILRR